MLWQFLAFLVGAIAVAGWGLLILTSLRLCVVKGNYLDLFEWALRHFKTGPSAVQVRCNVADWSVERGSGIEATAAGRPNSIVGKKDHFLTPGWSLYGHLTKQGVKPEWPNPLFLLAPRVGLEPTTRRLTAACSTN